MGSGSQTEHKRDKTESVLFWRVEGFVSGDADHKVASIQFQDQFAKVETTALSVELEVGPDTVSEFLKDHLRVDLTLHGPAMRSLNERGLCAE
jgi:hypothetical protein